MILFLKTATKQSLLKLIFRRDSWTTLRICKPCIMVEILINVSPLNSYNIQIPKKLNGGEHSFCSMTTFEICFK